MKTTAKKFTAFGNLGLEQIKAEPETTFRFKPGGPEIRTGKLIISESTGEGIVGKLIALNNTESYLLLTDADLLTGAKQNRVINESVLLAPHSKTLFDVSCIERLRWQYKERNFSNPDTTADPELRKTKAVTKTNLKNEPESSQSNIQSTVWSHIKSGFIENEFSDRTESYHELASYCRRKKASEFPVYETEKGCNGFAVVINGKVSCIDVFGTQETFQYYFPMLRDSAFRVANTSSGIKIIDIHEAFYKTLAALDNYEIAEKKPESNYCGVGSLKAFESKQFTGFELISNRQLIHSAIFSK